MRRAESQITPGRRSMCFAASCPPEPSGLSAEEHTKPLDKVLCKRIPLFFFHLGTQPLPSLGSCTFAGSSFFLFHGGSEQSLEGEGKSLRGFHWKKGLHPFSSFKDGETKTQRWEGTCARYGSCLVVQPVLEPRSPGSQPGAPSHLSLMSAFSNGNRDKPRAWTL